ncbi:hypothetical protein [Planobispora longispora]|uniref:Uncharacterized protein n=1 Tax=Planobispora longispora TaxID=28887 RepID=A0A8J3W4T5_9ACTN|nr:hypothetical protein [Planobispora longispora]BFE85862.1 hypothetical protein GCM10020093_084630 [Planobispora longispora]GIH76112.1 hypothetical protein Plo01_25410 [Planobispora longispora]
MVERPVPHEAALHASGAAESASAAAAALVWISVALFATGVIMSLGEDRRRGHLGWVESSGTEYVAVCECGWRDTAREEATAAFVEAGNHAGRVDLQVRPLS